METSSQPISIESFSYSWLVNMKPSSSSLESSSVNSVDEASSFIEMDPRMPPSKRFLINNNNKKMNSSSQSQDFKFDFPISQSHLADLVHADDLFSNGYLTPLFLKMESSCAPYNTNNHYENDDPSSSSSSSSSSYSSSISNPIHHHPSSSSSSSSTTKMGGVGSTSHHGGATTSRCPSLKRCRTLSRRVFQKYLNFLRPLCRRLRGHHHHHKSNGNNNNGSSNEVINGRIIRGGCTTSETSPRISVAYSAADDYWRKSCDSESSIYEAVLHCKRSIERS